MVRYDSEHEDIFIQLPEYVISPLYWTMANFVIVDIFEGFKQYVNDIWQISQDAIFFKSLKKRVNWTYRLWQKMGDHHIVHFATKHVYLSYWSLEKYLNWSNCSFQPFQIDTSGKWLRFLTKVCYLKLKKLRYLDKLR